MNNHLCLILVDDFKPSRVMWQATVLATHGVIVKAVGSFGFVVGYEVGS